MAIDTDKTVKEPALLRVPVGFAAPEEALRTALKLDLPNVLILAEREDGALVYLSSPEMSSANVNWLLDRTKKFLLHPEGFERKDGCDD